MKAAIYVRRSKDEKGSFSLETQEQDARRYADENHIEAVGVYADDGVSGAKTSRPGLDDMLADAEAGKFDVILIRDTDRLTRDAAHALSLSNLLQTWGVVLWSIREGMQDTAGEDRFQYGLMALVGEQERKRTTDRMKRGKRASAEQGHYRGGEIPYGLRLVPCDRHPDCTYNVLALDETEQGWLKDVYRWIVEDGLSGNAVADRLNDQGVPTRRGQPWTRQGLRQILKNPRVMGQATSWKVAQELPRIYTPAEFARLQRALEVWSTRFRNTGQQRTYPLSGRIICGCGAHWTGRLQKGKPYYACSQHPAFANRKHPVCDWTDRRWLQAEVVEAAIGELLYQHLIMEREVEVGVTRFLSESRPADPKEVAQARAEVDKLEDRLSVLYERITELDPGAFKKATVRAEDRLAAARDRLADLESSEIGEVDVPALVRQVEDWFGSHDLAELATLLDVKVQLTGFDSFTVSYGIDVGPGHVRQVIS